VLQAGTNLHEHICESLELFGREVLPAVQGARRAMVKAKAERLARWSSGPDPAGRRAHATSAPPDYSFPGMPQALGDQTGSEEMRDWLEHFATPGPKAIHDESLGILGN